MTARRYAQQGDESTCRTCGRKVEFREVASDATTGAPVYRWVAVRKTLRAPVPIICMGGGSNHTRHDTDAHDDLGAPR